MPNPSVRTLPSRQFAHPFDRPVKVEGDEQTHGVDPSSEAIGGFYGIGWYEAFKDHQTGQLYIVHCSDGVNRGKSAHSQRDMEWMEAMRKRIVAHTTNQRIGPIKISTHEWAIMLHFSFSGWLDSLPGEELKIVGDPNRHLDEGQIGTINGLAVVVDPKAGDNLPPIGNFDGEEPSLTGRTRTAAPRHETTRFEGVLAAAFAKAGLTAS